MSKEYPWGKGTPTWTRDAAANDSDKSYTTPTGKIREYFVIRAELTCTATVGNRVLGAVVTNGTDPVFATLRSANITASQVGTLDIFCATGGPSSAVSSTEIRLESLSNVANVSAAFGWPRMILPAGYVLRIWDIGAIDAAADDMVVTLEYVEYDA